MTEDKYYEWVSPEDKVFGFFGFFGFRRFLLMAKKTGGGKCSTCKALCPRCEASLFGVCGPACNDESEIGELNSGYTFKIET